LSLQDKEPLLKRRPVFEISILMRKIICSFRRRSTSKDILTSGVKTLLKKKSKENQLIETFEIKKVRKIGIRLINSCN